jgi:Fic family protein
MDLKEKILKDVAEKSEYVTYDDIVENVKEEIHEAMDELSKIVAIAFAKWCMDNTCQDMNLDNDWTYNPNDTQIFDSKTDDELFHLFTQSKEYKELMDGK